MRAPHSLETFIIFSWIFFQRNHSPQHRQKKCYRAYLERVLNRERDSARRSARHAEVAKDVRQRISKRSAYAYEETLHDEAYGALILVQFVRNEGAKRLHRNIYACV